MTVLEFLSALVAAIVGLAGLSLIVNPNGQFPQVISTFGDALANNIKAAKAF